MGLYLILILLFFGVLLLWAELIFAKRELAAIRQTLEKIETNLTKKS